MNILTTPSYLDFDDISASSSGEELQRLIDQKLLTPVFQPIIDLDHHSILGFEALTRGPKDSPLAQPNELFAAAVSHKQLAALEYACREAACTAFAKMDLPGKLFLNMTPLSFTDSQYRDGVTLELLRQLNINPERVVFELTEKHPLEDFILLRGACDHFKRQGFAVAIDDLGAGYAGLRVWSELNPHYVKIDQHFIRDIDSNPTKREFVRAMLDIALRIGNKVIAEGVETEDELRTLVTMGVQYVQGFYLARPHAEPLKEAPVHIKDLSLSLMPHSPSCCNAISRCKAPGERNERQPAVCLPAAGACCDFSCEILRCCLTIMTLQSVMYRSCCDCSLADGNTDLM